METEKSINIVFANTAEAFEDILVSSGGSDEGQKRIRHELALSQRAFFWEDDNKIVVTPFSIPEELLDLNSNILKFSNTSNYSPRNGGLNLSNSIDLYNFKELVGEKDVVISPYAITSSFLELVEKAREIGIDVFVDGEPSKGGYDLIRYLDSKSGFRKEVEKLNVSCPEGYICQTIEELENKIDWFKTNKRPFALKADQGESGWGLILVDDPQTTTDSLINQVTIETIWSNGPYIIEELIDVDATVGGGTPSAELFVTESEVKITYLCGQIVINGEFQGTVVGNGSIPLDIAKKLEESALVIGKHFQSLGYQGIFDIDYVISKTGEIFAVETNARRTGGTHVYDLAKRLFGADFQNHSFISNDHFEYIDDIKSIGELLSRVSTLIYSKDSKKGIIITLINETDHILGYVAIGNDLGIATNIAEELKNLLT
jgi:hypothetical protein